MSAAGALWFAAMVSVLCAETPPVDPTAQNRVVELRAEIAHHDELYFRKAAPEISDADYDRLKRELVALEQEHPEWAKPANVGDDRSGRFPTYVHRQRMLSLDKTYTETEWRSFYAGVAQRLGRSAPVFVVEPKYDGLAISLTYERGRLTHAVTRGNGTEGDDVTDNVRTIKTLPLELRRTAAEDGAANPIPDWVELRGEIYVDDAEFARINAAREAGGEEPFAHPRNLAAGTLNSSDAREVTSRRLSIVIYNWGAWVGEGAPATQQAFHAQVRAWGLPGVAKFQAIDSAEAGWAAIAALGRERGTLGYPIDGAVLKLDDVAARTRLGESEHAPHWAIAYKYEPETAVTEVRAITLQVGRTGVLTPVAELEPVELGGTRVTRATLHNRAMLARRDVRVGDFVEVEKAGEVVPAVVAVQPERRPAGTRPYEFPVRCPSCAAPLESNDGEVAVRCPNANCPAQRQRRLEHFASAAAVDIPGLGPATIETLVREGLVTGPADFYWLRTENLAGLAGIGAPTAEKLRASIERSRGAELWRFIYGLGIPQVGAVNARKLAAACGSFDGLARLPADELTSLVGPAVADSVREFLEDPVHRAEVQALAVAGLHPKTARVSSSGRLAGRTFIFTGTLPGLTREEASARVTAAGGIVHEHLAGATSYLVVGENPGQKLAEARRLGVKVITAAEFSRMLGAD